MTLTDNTLAAQEHPCSLAHVVPAVLALALASVALPVLAQVLALGQRQFAEVSVLHKQVLVVVFPVAIVRLVRKTYPQTKEVVFHLLQLAGIPAAHVVAAWAPSLLQDRDQC